MSTKLRWALRILGWLLVLMALAPRSEVRDEGPGETSTLALGIVESPLYVRTKTVIRAGIANLAQAEEVHSSQRFEIASWSMLLLLAGALTVTLANRRPRGLRAAG